MQITEEMLKMRFAKNLSTYRKLCGLTQLHLAQKLNYSDKSVSKWERGEGLPDLVVTATIADILGVTVSDLLSEKPNKRIIITRNKFIITALSIGVAWLIATLLFVIFELALPSFKSWLFFIYAIPVSAIISIVFSCIWWKKIHRFLSVSLLIWSSALCLMLSIPVQKISLIFTISAVLQVMTILWFLIKKTSNSAK